MPLWVASVAASVIAVALVAVFAVPGSLKGAVDRRAMRGSELSRHQSDRRRAIRRGRHGARRCCVPRPARAAGHAGGRRICPVVAAAQRPADSGRSVRTDPQSGPVKVGAFTAPIANVTGFAVSKERGTSLPPSPSLPLLAQGSRA